MHRIEIMKASVVSTQAPWRGASNRGAKGVKREARNRREKLAVIENNQPEDGWARNRRNGVRRHQAKRIENQPMAYQTRAMKSIIKKAKVSRKCDRRK
jgi:hypothetical protein